MLRKVGELQLLVNEINPHVIMLTETWLNPGINNAAVSIGGYEIVPDLRCDRQETTGGVGGGLLVYVKEGLVVVPRMTKSDFNQHCSFTLKTKNESLDFILVYRPPSSGAENLNKLCELLVGATERTVFIGDFNLPGIDWESSRADSRGRPVLDAATEAGLEQLVEWPTHTKGNRLDLILTNMADRVVKIKDEGRLGNSDHIMLGMKIDVGFVEMGQVKERLNWRKANFDKIRKDMEDLDWYGLFERLNVEEMWEIFKNEVTKTVEKNVPMCQILRSNRQRWMSKQIVGLLRRKKKCWKIHKRDRTQHSREEYEKAAKEVKYAIRRSKAKSEKELAFSKDDNGRKFRNYVKAKTKSRPGVGPLLNGAGEPVTNPKDMANILNNYFGSVFTKEDCANIPQKPIETNEKLNTIDIWEKDILQKM